MKLRVDKMSSGISTGIFFWDEGPENSRRKVVQSLSLNDEFFVDDQTGHEIISKYKDIFKVVHYGSSPEPVLKNAMVKDMKVKDESK